MYGNAHAWMHSSSIMFTAQMSFKYRGLMDLVTAMIYVALILAVVGFNLWTQSTLGVLTLLLLTEIVYAFPAAFPMPLPLYLAATVVNTIILATLFILSALNAEQLLHGVASLSLICIFAALTGAFTNSCLRRCAKIQLNACSCATTDNANSSLEAVAAVEQPGAAIIHAAAFA